jgi:hypothetical protein
MKLGVPASWAIPVSDQLGVLSISSQDGYFFQIWFLTITNQDIAMAKDLAILVSTILAIIYTTFLIRLASRKLKGQGTSEGRGNGERFKD